MGRHGKVVGVVSSVPAGAEGKADSLGYGLVIPSDMIRMVGQGAVPTSLLARCAALRGRSLTGPIEYLEAAEKNWPRPQAGSSSISLCGRPGHHVVITLVAVAVNYGRAALRGPCATI